MDNRFENKGGEQNIAQGKNAIGKQENYYGVPSEVFAKYVEELGVTKSALTSFFKILEQEQVPSWELDSKLREIAERYRNLLYRFQTISSDDPEVRSLKEQAKNAIEGGRFAEAEDLLAQARERDRQAVVRMKASVAEQLAALEKRQLSEAASCVEQAKLQRLQYRYAKSAQYLREAAAALPEGHKAERAEYLGAAGQDLYSIARYTEALRLCEHGLSIEQEIGNRKEEATSLNNISQIYQALGEYGKTLEYLKQSLLIFREPADKEGQGATLNNIAMLAYAKGYYPEALYCLEQSLSLHREIQNRDGEGATLNNIGLIHDAQGDYDAALDYYKQALIIAREIKDKHGESTRLNNISGVYQVQENYDAALEYAEQNLAIRQQIGDRRGEGTTLNNLAMIYEAQGDCPAALKQYEQALSIAKEIGDKDGEATCSGNIGWLYKEQGQLAKAEPYLSRAVELGMQLEHPKLEEWRKILKEVRTELREQGN